MPTRPDGDNSLADGTVVSRLLAEMISAAHPQPRNLAGGQSPLKRKYQKSWWLMLVANS